MPETLSALELLEQLRARSGRMMLVVDEYGVLQGLITQHDFLEAITGELNLGAHIEAWAIPLGSGGWQLDRGRYNTVAGLLMAEAGRLPAVGDVIDCAGWSFEVTGLDGRRIDKVLARPLEISEST